MSGIDTVTDTRANASKQDMFALVPSLFTSGLGFEA